MSTETDFPERPVYLGFGNVLESHLAYRLQSHYMPLGKIGGKPAWLNPVNLPPFASVLCRVCEKPSAFLIQVYATSPNDEEYSFHRTIFFFICRNPRCSLNDVANNIRAFRCALPRLNDFYAPEGSLDPDLDGDIPDPFWKQSYPHLCRTCGCIANKKCGRCEQTWYCCRLHQLIDWSTSHKSDCCKQSSAAKQPSTVPVNEDNDDNDNWVKPKRSVAANPFVFPEYAIEMDTEHLSGSSRYDSDDDGDSDDDHAEKRMEEYRQFIKKHKGPSDLGNDDLEDLDDFVVKDLAFKRFNKVVSVNPEQVLRYDRGGEPLLATDHAPAPQAIPPCSLCGSERQFELQLMPHLLSLIGVDKVKKSVDWATVLLYTCAKNCRIPNDGYAEEYVHKQDFH